MPSRICEDEVGRPAHSRKNEVKDRVEVIGVEDRDRWERATSGAGFPSQSWAYAWGLSASGVDPKLGVVHAGGAILLIPFVERAWRGHRDIATFHSMSGASVRPQSTAPFILWHEFAREKGWLSGYLQMAPYDDFLLDVPGATVLPRNHAFFFDVVAEGFVERASRTIRTKIRMADQMGMRPVVGHDNNAEALTRLYPECMQRLNAAQTYRFSETTLDRWACDSACLLLGAERGNGIEAVSLFRSHGGIAEAQLYASTPECRSLQPWLISQSLPLLRERGAHTLNFGGAEPGQDGLYGHKTRFHGSLRPTKAVCQVYDAALFNELCAAAPAGDASYFPKYRMRM
jgi:hypothetical protein